MFVRLPLLAPILSGCMVSTSGVVRSSAVKLFAEGLSAIVRTEGGSP